MKVWVVESRDDEFCEHSVDLYTSKRKAYKAVREWAEDFSRKKWRSLKVDGEIEYGYGTVIAKEPGRFLCEVDNWIKGCEAYEMEVK